MNCCDCPWKNTPAIEYEVFEANGLVALEENIYKKFEKKFKELMKR
jgi:hypothetical protein